MIPLPENVHPRALHWTPILEPTVRKIIVKVTQLIVIAVIFSIAAVIISAVTIIVADTVIVPTVAIIVLVVDVNFSR